MIISYDGQQVAMRGGIDLRIRSDPVYNTRRVLTGRDVTWDMDILLTSQKATEALCWADIKQKTAQLEAMFSSHGGDLLIKSPTGVSGFHALRNNDCLGGVRILQPPSYPNGKGVEQLMSRTVSLAVGGRVPVPDADLDTFLVEFRESLEQQPAGLKKDCLETLVERAVPQTLRQYQTYRYSQSGSAKGLYSYPNVPPPVWPAALVNSVPYVRKDHPESIGGALTNWPIEWSYQYASPIPLLGTPHLWGVNWF